TVVEGGNATFSTAAIGTAPLSFRWRTHGYTFPGGRMINGPTYAAFTATNVPLLFSNFACTVVVTNIAGQAPVSAPGRLYVLPDRDHDGLPDQWEIDRGFNPDDPDDGAADADGDGMSNAAEYIAGTIYTNAASRLKLDFAVGSTSM